MVATIASLAVQLSANATGLYAGMNAAQARIGSFARNVQGTLSGIPLIGGAIAQLPLSTGGLENWLKDGIDRINAMRNAAIQLGVPLKDMGGLALVFGGNMEAASKGLLHARKTILDAAESGKGAAGVFAKLGITANELAAMGGKQQIEALFESMRKLGDSTQIAAAAFEIFGERRGANFLTFIARGKAGLDLAAEAAKRFGLSVDEVDANQVFLASKALKQIDLALTGIKINMAVALAPILVEINDSFKNMEVNAGFVQDKVTSVSKILGEGAAYAIKAWQGLVVVWDLLRIGLDSIIQATIRGIQKILELAASLPGMGGLQQTAEDFKSIADILHDDLMKDGEKFKKDWNALLNDDPFKRVENFFARVADKVAQAKAAQEAPKPPAFNAPPTEVKLAGAASFGSQEAYKTLGEFAAGGQTSTLQKLVDQNKRIADLIQKGDLDLAEIRKQLKRGMVREGKI